MTQAHEYTQAVRDIDVLRTWCASSLLNYTRYMFRQKSGTRFVVGDHHRIICEALQRVILGKCPRLIINMPPRYGKTEIISKMFVGYGLALNPRAKFIEISYSDDLVLDNSREVNEMLRSDYHTRLFPECEARNIAAKKWMTTAGGGVYAVSTGGQVTGFGAGQTTTTSIEEVAEELSGPTFAGALIIDDFIKPDDALSDNIRTSANARFENTIRSRLNSRETPIVVVMQRVHEDDLCGHLLKVDGRKEEGGEWEVLSLPALSYDAEGNEVALWPYKHTTEELRKMASRTPFVFETQYQQNPKPLEGLMYQSFRTYDIAPIGGVAKNYTDTADTGADFLCSICYIETPQGLYITDVVHTDRPMEYTEVAVADMLNRNDTRVANIESNNGGRGFARNVERNLREMGNRTTTVKWFHQSNNKAARIATNSATVQNMVFFPSDWATRWPTFFGALIGYRAKGKNAHDDAPDALTGCVEMMQAGGRGTRFSRT